MTKDSCIKNQAGEKYPHNILSVIIKTDNIPKTNKYNHEETGSFYIRDDRGDLRWCPRRGDHAERYDKWTRDFNKDAKTCNDAQWRKEVKKFYNKDNILEITHFINPRRHGVSIGDRRKYQECLYIGKEPLSDDWRNHWYMNDSKNKPPMIYTIDKEYNRKSYNPYINKDCPRNSIRWIGWWKKNDIEPQLCVQFGYWGSDSYINLAKDLWDEPRI